MLLQKLQHASETAHHARRIVRAAVIEDARAIHEGIRRLKMRLAHSVPAA